MIVERPGAERGVADAGWLDSRHTFSFGHYHDPRWMGFGALRVVNEDRVAPGAGFATHHHANMEILSYVLSGALEHRDNTGGGGMLRPGELQWMSAGHGIDHSEFNASADEPVHFLQVWIQPDRVNAPPAHAQRSFDAALRRSRWATLASPDGADGSLAMRQQAWLRGLLLEDGDVAEFVPDPARRYWLHVASGAVTIGERTLRAGDALGFVEESTLQHLTGQAADLLLFDLP